LFVLVGTVGTRYKAIIALAIILQCGALAGGIGAGGGDDSEGIMEEVMVERFEEMGLDMEMKLKGFVEVKK